VKRLASAVCLLLTACRGSVAASAPPDQDAGPADQDAASDDAPVRPVAEAGPPHADASAATCAPNGAAPARPAQLALTAAAGPDGRIYVAMGALDQTMQVQAYDVVDNTWSPLPALPIPPGATVTSVGAAATASTVYVMPLLGNDPFTPVLYAWDAAAGAWAQRAPFALEIGDAAVSTGATADLVAVGSKLYVTGGETTGLYEYDEAADRWAVLPFPPATFDVSAAAATDDGRVFVLGTTDSNAVYDVAAAAWKRVPDQPVPRYGPVAAYAGGRVYSFGGWCQGYPTCPNEDDVLDATSLAWSAGARLPFAIEYGSGAAVVGCDGRIYVFGGQAGTQRLDPVTQSWDWSP
jgi:hypothetical protein